MKEEQMILFARALSRCNLSEKEQEVLTAVAMTLSGHSDVFRACYIAFMNDEPSYHYHPMIGAPLEFFYEKNSCEFGVSKKKSLYLVRFLSSMLPMWISA